MKATFRYKPIPNPIPPPPEIESVILELTPTEAAQLKILSCYDITIPDCLRRRVPGISYDITRDFLRSILLELYGVISTGKELSA